MAERTTRVLSLVRHAKSSWRYDLEDARRPLNKRGLRDCQRVSPVLASRLGRPDLVLCSDAARTVQTCQAIADALDISAAVTRIDHALYLADRATLLAAIAGAPPDAGHVMVIGHNPGLTDLLNHLCPDFLDNLPTFGIAVLEVSGHGWDDLRQGTATLRDLLVPKAL
jgi:phosphohistidine phosphatase